MSIGEDFRTHLLASTGISTVVATRIHQNHMPEESAYPAIWFRRSGEEELVLLDGRCGTIRTRFDLECLSTSIDTAIDLSKTVKDALHGYRGSLTGTSGTVQGIFVEDKDDTYIPHNEGSDSGRCIVALDITLWST